MLPQVDEKKLFFLSGLIAISFFLILCFLFAIMLFRVTHVKTYGMEKKHYVSISLEAVPLPKQQQKQNSPFGKNPQVKKSPKKSVAKIKKTVRKHVDAVNENVDIDSLFNNVWTKKIDTHVKKKPKIDAKRLAEIQKRVDLLDTAEEKTPHNDLTEAESGSKERATSSGEEVNEYSAKIHAIVYNNFFPPPNTEGYKVKAVIELSPLGKVLDFRILNYSASMALNEEVDRIKKRIQNEIFPPNPKNENARIIIILKPEEKE